MEHKNRKEEKSTVILVCDGIAEPNPGRIGIGFIIYPYPYPYPSTTESYGNRLPQPKPIFKESRRIGQGTNNIAEYQALIAGLRWVLQADGGYVLKEIRLDSQLVINQLVGRWSVRSPHLGELARQARILWEKAGRPPLVWIPGERNPADEVAKLALSTFGRLHPVRRTRKEWICRECGAVIPKGTSCFRQNVYFLDARFGKPTRVCLHCGEGLQAQAQERG